ncbi:hypothetical protein [Moorena sp. SIO1F2]|nr:hypothetical protein [Moorena sp. SIO1F2]
MGGVGGVGRWGDGEMGSQMSNWRVPIFKNVSTYAKVLDVG